jgi:hypothetical protein
MELKARSAIREEVRESGRQIGTGNKEAQART